VIKEYAGSDGPKLKSTILLLVQVKEDMIRINGFTPTNDTWPIVNPEFGSELVDFSDEDTDLPVGLEDKVIVKCCRDDANLVLSYVYLYFYRYSWLPIKVMQLYYLPWMPEEMGSPHYCALVFTVAPKRYQRADIFRMEASPSAHCFVSVRPNVFVVILHYFVSDHGVHVFLERDETPVFFSIPCCILMCVTCILEDRKQIIQAIDFLEVIGVG